MDLPLTSKGAQQALVKVGLWSPQSANSSRFPYSPFPSDVLNCAAALREYEKKRRQDLYKVVQQKGVHPSKKEDRVDLTQLPSICIDAKRASFRDDAIGVRLRSSTGRKVIRGSKWEILIHITDVSDLYITQSSIPSIDLTLLRKTAENRGSSRYDLPLGPLHLIPPVALEALAFDVKRSDSVIDTVNRCVSIWAYIDENTGKIIDSGLERTLIQQPIPLSFEEASELLECSDDSLSNRTKQVKMLLQVIEKAMTKWKATQLRSNVAAQQREKRLKVKEMVAKETIGIDSSRDDGANGSFQRTRGHRLVDYTLDLYGVTLSFMMKKTNAPIPRVSGSGEEERGGRVGSAPLRRYIDGMIQRQALSVLCNYGDPPMTKNECLSVSKIATQAINRITNHRSSQSARTHTANLENNSADRKKALRRLESHFTSLDAGRQRIIPALTTGVNNQVIISGIGLRVTCKGVNGTLKSGERVKVIVTKLDSKTGTIEVKLASNI
jgi:exoribonuclease R